MYAGTDPSGQTTRVSGWAAAVLRSKIRTRFFRAEARSRFSARRGIALDQHDLLRHAPGRAERAHHRGPVSHREPGEDDGQEEGFPPLAEDDEPDDGLRKPEHEERDGDRTAEPGDLHERRECDLRMPEMPREQPGHEKLRERDRRRGPQRHGIERRIQVVMDQGEEQELQAPVTTNIANTSAAAGGPNPPKTRTVW